MAEHTLVLVPPMTEVLVLRPLVASRNAARVALGRLHPRSAAVELGLLVVLWLGTLARPALGLLAVRRHRSSSVRVKVAFRSAYHLATV